MAKTEEQTYAWRGYNIPVAWQEYQGQQGVIFDVLGEEEALRQLAELFEHRAVDMGNFLGYSSSSSISRRMSKYGILSLGRDNPRLPPRQTRSLSRPVDPETPSSYASGLSPLAASIIELLQKHRESIYSLEALSVQFDRSLPSIQKAIEELRAARYDLPDMGDAEGGRVTLAPPAIAQPNEPLVLPGWGTTEIVAGLVSDTHDGSKFQATDELEATYDRFAEEGITEVLHAGDLIGGPGIVGYRGHLWETIPECEGPEGSIEHAVSHYPQRPGITTRFVQGSHDDWWRLKHGQDLLQEVCERRPDLICLGRDTARLQIGPAHQTRVCLMHPDSGSAYALSYKPQKFVEGLLGGTKPHMLIIGHYHRAGWFPMRNIETLLAACFEWQTPFLARKGIEPVVGGFILRMVLDPDGWIREFQTRFLPYYYREGD